MHRRDCLRTLSAAALALPGAARGSAAAEKKSRFRAAICCYSFRAMFEAKSITYADVIRMASGLGVDMELTTYWLPDTTDQTLLPLKKLAFQSAVSIYSLGIGAKIAQPTPELRAVEVETVRKWLDVAEKLGAGHVRAWGGGIPKGATPDQAMPWAVETVKRCAEDAAKKGIFLGIEDDGGLTANADRTVELVKKADSPWVGINIDVGNFPDNAYAQIEMCAPYGVGVHYKPSVRVGGQRQPTDLPRVLKILGAAGFSGRLALEYESREEDPRTAVPKTILQMLEAIRAA